MEFTLNEIQSAWKYLKRGADITFLMNREVVPTHNLKSLLLYAKRLDYILRVEFGIEYN